MGVVARTSCPCEPAVKPQPAMVGVLEVGGSHVAAALARSGCLENRIWRPLNAAWSAPAVVDALVTAVRMTRVPTQAPLVVAVPGPFDYERGVAHFEGVGKFDALRGVDLRASLTQALDRRSECIWFLNDADAFAIGEWASQPHPRPARFVGITLGTGVGSAWLEQGRRVTAGPHVPPQGRVHYLLIDGQPLEEVVSARAILSRYRSLVSSGHGLPSGIRGVMDRARSGDAIAKRVCEEAICALGISLGPWLARFEADLIAMGGGLVRDWDIIGPALLHGLSESGITPPPLHLADDSVRSALLGAAAWLVTSDNPSGQER